MSEIPDAMIESRIEELVQDFQYRISQQGLKIEQYLQYMGMTMEQFKEQFREQAEKQVKMRLAMEAIVAKENIEATEEEFEDVYKRQGLRSAFQRAGHLPAAAAGTLQAGCGGAGTAAL